MTTSDEEEYESTTSSNDDGSDDEEEEQWSLRVRLLSAVDLPPSLSPTVPLCPWFKFGLVEDIVAALEGTDDDDDADDGDSNEEEEGQRHSRKILPKRNEEDGSDDEESSQKQNKIAPRKSSSNNNTTTNPIDNLLNKISINQQRTSSFKLMSKSTNGGGGNGADWNEEYRWDTLQSPMESALVVKLCTRLAPSPTSTDFNNNNNDNMNYGSHVNIHHYESDNYLNSSDNTSSQSEDTSQQQHLTTGIRGLWRKGRVQYEEHRRKSTVAASGGGTGGSSADISMKEQQAANVAQFLMKSSSGGSGIGEQQQQQQSELVEYQQKWRERKGSGSSTTGSGIHDNHDDSITSSSVLSTNNNNMKITAPTNTTDNEQHYSEGLCLGTLTIPFNKLPLEDAVCGNGAAVVERWYQLDDPNGVGGGNSTMGMGGDLEDDNKLELGGGGGDDEPTLLHGPRRCPSVLLEITFANADYLDQAEDEILVEGEEGANTIDLSSLAIGEDEKENAPTTAMAAAPSTPVPSSKKEVKKPEEPELEPGVVDFVCIIGARDIGDQRNDDGSKGWVESTPECCVLERFPPDDEFHINNGRMTGLIPQVEWFCFPEGCKLWRGPNAPTHDDLKAGGVSTISHPTIDFSSSNFDTCLNAASSFSWFVLSSNSDVYGSKLVKTYGTMVRFYVPAPKGVDPRQDDFAQMLTGGEAEDKAKSGSYQKRLWVPIGICLTTTLPIVGVIEEILLRTCNAMQSQLVSNESSNFLTNSDDSASLTSKIYGMLQKDLFHLIVNFSMPIPGVVHCSIPFLEGERLHITASPPNGLPPLPHGSAIASACRLLGAEGLTLLLAAALTECRILIHSVNIANVAMVAEVITALIFPFTWQLPYIPVLPKDMLEILDAPLPFFVGVATATLKYVDKSVLSELVVVDLDDVAGSTEYDGRRGTRTKIPPALPASVSTSISKALFRLLREDDELEELMKTAMFPGCRRSPRLENESMPERKFRIHVSLQICSLIRGYQDCLFFVSASQPVFNRDRFLRQAPALFEDKRPTALIDINYTDRMAKILSPRSKRFLSVLVNSQHFHQLLERLSEEETSFFHEVMDTIEPEEDPATGSKNYFSTSFGTPQCEAAAEKLYESLEMIEQQIPTYRIDRAGSRRALGKCTNWLDDSDEEFKLEDYGVDGINDTFWLDDEDKTPTVSFTHSILQPIVANKGKQEQGTAGVHALSFEYLVELEKNPWRFNNMLALPTCGKDDQEEEEESKDDLILQHIKVLPRIKLRDAIGDQRYSAWKIAIDHKDEDDMLGTPVIEKADIENAFDLSSILLGVPELPLENSSSGGYDSQPRIDAEDRNKIRQCLELVFGSGETNFKDNDRDLIVEAELALRNPSAQRYLFSVLSQRTKIENQRRKRTQDESKRTSTQQSISRLEPIAFDCICRLCYAVLEACREEQNYESAYRLLTYTGGFCTTAPTNAGQSEVQKSTYMTERIKLHPIFADLRLWERVLLLHQQDQQNDRKEDASNANLADDDSSHGGTVEDNPDADAYEAAVSTLYEMVGYGVPAEELASFATRVSEEKGWFSTEKGQALLVLARRLTAKRDEGEADISDDVGAGDFSFARQDSAAVKDANGGGVLDMSTTLESEEIAWSHPSICPRHVGKRSFAIPNNIRHGDRQVLDAPGHSGRVAITAMAAFGSTAVATGGVDGSVFLAHTIQFGDEKKSDFVNGLKLQWGTKGDGNEDIGSGSVSCLVAAKGSGYRFGGPDNTVKNPGSSSDDDEVLAAVDGCRVIAGMTSGGLRVWSLKDIYQAGYMMRNETESPSHFSSGADDFGMKEAVAGVAIGGHRGGITCIDVPPAMYRPDSLISGGEDGLIKLWSLKSSSTSDQAGAQSPQRQSRFFNSRQIVPVAPIDFDVSDAQVLTGHQGRIICIKTAWHGDKLLSGGADKTVRLWDLSGSMGNPLSTFQGHQGIVTQTHFWGPNTIVSASTDRSIALWDTRAGSSPIFALRHHLAPVSDLILGNRSEPLMISAGADGSLATWDFRVLSGKNGDGPDQNSEAEKPHSSRTVRTPITKMNHIEQTRRGNNCGSVKLSRALGRDDFSFLSASDDGIINEWEASSGRKLSSHYTGHKDALSGFEVYSSKDGMRQNRKIGVNAPIGGVVSCSWDGTVRLRRLSRKPAR